MPAETWTCPVASRSDDDVVGCATTFEAEADDEGWVDCPECGIVFSRAGEDRPGAS